jgi:hypothetical protein
MGEPTFTVKTATETTAGFLVEVNVSTEGGLWHRFTGKTEKEANCKAQAFIADRRGAFLKSLAAKEARRAGRIRQSLKASSEPERA